MAKADEFWAQLWIFEKNKMDPWVAFRAALGMALSLAIGYLLGSQATGLAIAIGALNVCYSDKSDAYRERGKRMLASALLSGVAIFVAAYSARDPLLMFLVLTAGTFFAGLLVVVDTVAAELGVIVLVSFLIFSTQPLNPEKSLMLSLSAIGGGLLQSFISIALWPLRRYQPERRALGTLYDDLASLAASKKYLSDTAPMGSSQSIATQEALHALASDNRQEARRYRSLLSQGERLRLTLLSLLRLHKRLQRQSERNYSEQAIVEVLQTAAIALREISDVIMSGQANGQVQRSLNQIENLTTQVRSQNLTSESAFLRAVLNDLVFQLEALGGQLRAASELAAKTTRTGMDKAEQIESSRPLHLRFWGVLATLRANLTLQSSGFRHAIRLSVCVALGELICYIFREDLNRAYWVPMTIVIVLKPDYGSTVRRSFLRILGTLVGLILATALFHVLPENAAAEISLIVLFTFLTRWVGSANYGIFAMCVGALVVLLIAMTGVAPRDVMWARGLNTFIGGAIALFVSWCWPTSEKLQMSEVIAHMLETYLEYFRAITKTLVGESRDASEMDRLRQTARVARANFLASLERYTQERRARFDDLKVISAVTVASNRFAHAMMAVEAGSSQDISLEQGKAFQSFAGSVEKDLQLLCEYLCVREVSAREFPDLRADYVLFAESKAHNGENFLYEEADRMTNSLSTLTEQILRRKIQRPITAS